MHISSSACAILQGMLQIQPCSVFCSGCCPAEAGPSSSAQQQPHKKLSKLEELMQKDLQAKQRQAASAAATAAGGANSSGRGAVNGSKGRVDHWLYEGIVVKVLSKALKEQGYYKQKVRMQLQS